MEANFNFQTLLFDVLMKNDQTTICVSGAQGDRGSVIKLINGLLLRSYGLGEDNKVVVGF